MQVVILAGGLGSRISEESVIRPKPMIEIGGKPILWHIMKNYSKFDINEFIICCGYKGYMIKEYFANYFLHTCDVTFDMTTKDLSTEIHSSSCESWKVTLVDTGEYTQTGGRLLRVSQYLKNQPFCFTYGDGVSDINIKKLINCHANSASKATLTAVQPVGRYGALVLEDNNVINFSEKPIGDKRWINGGFFVLDKSVLELIEGDQTSWETDVLPILSSKGELNAFTHRGFWHPMDTLRDKKKLEELWNSGQVPWTI